MSFSLSPVDATAPDLYKYERGGFPKMKRSESAGFHPAFCRKHDTYHNEDNTNNIWPQM